MILLLDTSTPMCKLTLVDGDVQTHDEWEADRGLAKGLLAYIQQQLATQGKSWPDLTGLGAFKGPGSFTGLRIGLTVLNTLADSLAIPIVGGSGNNWQADALAALAAGQNDHLLLPDYGAEPHITQPRK